MTGRERSSLGGREVRMDVEVTVSLTTDGMKKENAVIALCRLLITLHAAAKWGLLIGVLSSWYGDDFSLINECDRCSRF